MSQKLVHAAKMTGEWRAERDSLIRKAHDAGGGVREIARMVSLSHPAILGILARSAEGQDDAPMQPAGTSEHPCSDEDPAE